MLTSRATILSRHGSVAICAALGFIAFASCAEKPDAPTAPASREPVTDTSYVMVSPAWTGFEAPEDVLVGREPFIYVADTGNDAIVMLDLAGRVVGRSKRIKRPVAIAQDYRFNLLVAGELDTTIGGTAVTIGAIFRIDLASAQHDISRALITTLYLEPAKANRRFTGIGALPDNTYLASRVGPLNTSPVDPDVSIIRIANNGTLISPVSSVSPVGNAINSIGGLSSLFVPDDSRNFAITQTDREQQFRVQIFSYFSGSEGEGWRPAMQPSFNDGDLMTVERFDQPHDIAYDRFGNIYVVDAARDSIYKFNTQGREFSRQSFGGDGVLSAPHGVAHFDRTLFVADTGNDRIVRFRLTTDN
ncbi:MAG: hypothetical protein H7X80_09340 [bacterium]|nr:hypothetical protein [Candidatus Kapabacteria bacterium]